MKFIPIFGGALLILLPFGAIADSHETCPLSYEEFEVGVPHTDLAECPASMQSEDAYCRLSLVAEVATVFAFSNQTDCILRTQTYYDDAFEISIE